MHAKKLSNNESLEMNFVIQTKKEKKIIDLKSIFFETVFETKNLIFFRRQYLRLILAVQLKDVFKCF